MARGQAGIVPTPFVGRDSELDYLWGLLSATLRGRPCFALLKGEAGSGKTRLLRELGEIARRLGVRVVRGHAVEDSATPYLLLLNVLDLGARDSGASSLATRLDELTSRSPGDLDAGIRRMRFYASLLREITASAQREPVLLLFDDLQWADAASLELLGQLVSTLAEDVGDQRLPLMIVAAHRPIAANDRLLKWLLSAQRESFVSTLELHGLGWNETSALLRAHGLTAGAQTIVDTVQRITHGHPLFVLELWHQLRRQGLVEEAACQAALKAKLTLPRDLRSALEQRVSALSDQELALLTHAACARDSFSAADIASLLGADESVVQRALEHARAAELLSAEASDFRFRHPLIRELLVTRIGPHTRRAIHARIAKSLAVEAPSGATSAEIARHLLAAHAPDLHDLLAHARRGAEHAASLFAWQEAGALYASAARAAEALDDVPQSEVGELYSLSALYHQHAFAFAESLELHDRALAAFKRAGDVSGQAEVLLQRTRTQYTSGSVGYGELLDIRAHEEVLAAAKQDEPAARGVLCEALALAYWNARDTSRAEQLAREALALARAAGRAESLADAQFSLGFVLFQAGHLQAALEAYASSLTRRSRREDSWARVLPLQRMCMVNTAFGQFAEAARLCDEADALTERVGHSAEAAFVAANRAILALARGDLEPIQAHARKALMLSRRARWPWGGVSALSALTWSRMLAGRYADAHFSIALLKKPGVVFDDPGPSAQFTAAVFRAYLSVCADPDARDPALAERVTQLLQASAEVPRDADTAFLFCMLIESGAQLALQPMPAWLHERVEGWFAQGMQFAPSAALSLARVLALSAAHLDNPEAAERYFREAIRATEAAGAKPELGRSLLDYASWLAPDRRELARELATRAHAVFTELQTPGLRERAHKLALACGATGIAAPAADSGSLNACEIALLRHIAYGRDSTDIGRDMLLAPDRVEALAGALFAKLGIDGRGLATAYAFAHGLVGANTEAVPGLKVLMVTDMEDFTGFVQRLGDLHARTVMHVHNRIIRQQLCEHAGREVTHTGDGLMAEFPSAQPAIACAMAIQQQLAFYSNEHPESPIRVRIGLNAGQVLAEEDRLFGAALIAAVRICACARPGSVLMSESVHTLLSPGDRALSRLLGEVPLKGFAEQLPVYEIALS